jgi:nitrous oxidase accessory protein
LVLVAALAAATATLPAAAQESADAVDLQTLIDATPTGGTLTLEPGIYRGGVTISRPMTLAGVGWPIVDGGGNGTVILVEAPDVTVRDLVIRNTGISLDRENSGIEANAPRTSVIGNRFEDVLFGIFLRQARDSLVSGNVISGKDLDLGRRGDAIRLWEATGTEVSDNEIRDARDIVLWFSDDLTIRNNIATGGRYGLHFMYSDSALVADNELTDNSVGVFLMYSRDLVLRDNVMARNNGPSGFGIGLKDVDGVIAEGNRFIDNRVGLHLDNSPWSYDRWQTFEGNMFAYNDIGVGFLPAVQRNIFTGNAFIDNGDQVAIFGSGTFKGNEWTLDGVGNYWSDFAGYDADGNGIGDIPYLLDDLYSNLTDGHPELAFFAETPAARAVGVAARMFPVLKPRPKVEDNAPLVDPPTFAPIGRTAPPVVSTPLLILSLVLLAAAAVVVLQGSSTGRRRNQEAPT